MSPTYFDGTLLRFHDGPRQEIDALRSQQFDGLFFAEMACAYGLEATTMVAHRRLLPGTATLGPSLLRICREHQEQA